MRIPQAVVLRTGSSVDAALLSFLEFAIDRQAVASTMAQATGAQPYFATSGSPWPFVDDVGPFMRATPDLTRARAARDLIRGRPHVRVAAEPGYEPLADYLVNALLAWNFRAEQVDRDSPFDLLLQSWQSEGSLPDAYIETCLAMLRGTPADTLVHHLAAARRMPDAGQRERMYRATLGRIAATDQFIVLYQPHVSVSWSKSLDVMTDARGRPRGPLFASRRAP